MGGAGSGRFGGHGKDTVEASKALDIRWLAREGYLKPGCCSIVSWTWRGEPSGSIQTLARDGVLELHYKVQERGQDWRSVVQRVDLASTPCTFGGSRPWFLCPRCHGRVGVLYGGALFWCRACHGLAYRSQQSSRLDRTISRVHELQRKLGGKPGGIASSIPRKPKRMQWRTYSRLALALREAQEGWTMGLYEHLKKLDKGLEKRFGAPC